MAELFVENISDLAGLIQSEKFIQTDKRGLDFAQFLNFYCKDSFIIFSAHSTD
jgi:hypothetical protein